MKKFVFIVWGALFLLGGISSQALAYTDSLAWGTYTQFPSGFISGNTSFFDDSNTLSDMIEDDDPEMQAAGAAMAAGLPTGQFILALSRVPHSEDPYDQYIGYFNANSIKSLLGFNHTFESDHTYISGRYVYWNHNVIDGTLDNSKLIRAHVNENGLVILEISSDSGATWTTVNRLRNQTYAEWLAEWGSNSETKVKARQDVAAISSRQTSKMISARVLNVFSPRPRGRKSTSSPSASFGSGDMFATGYRDDSGLSSGDAMDGVGVWTMGSYAANDVTKSGSKSESTVGVFMVGIDKMLMNDRLALGVAGGYENSWVKYKSSGGTTDGEGFALTPYLAYMATDNILIKGVLNYAANNYDTSTTGDYDGERLMGDLAVEYSWIIENWLISAEAGYMYVSESFDSGYSDVYLSECRASGKIGYEFENGALPYFRATYYKELGSSSRGFDDYVAEGALGVDYASESWIFSVEGFSNFNSDQTTYGGSAVIRYEF